MSNMGHIPQPFVGNLGRKAQAGASRADTYTMLESGEIRLDDLVVDHDPIIDTSTGHLTGADVMLPVAAPEDLPTQAWRLVLLNSLVTSVRWQQRGAVSRRFVTAIGVGSHQLDDPVFERAVRASLAGSGANPAGLQLVISDELLLHADPERIDALTVLTDLGVQLSVVGSSAYTHIARHIGVLEVSLLRVSMATDAEALPIASERATALDLQLMATDVNGERHFVDARRHGCSFTSGRFHRCHPYFEPAGTTVEPYSPMTG